MFAFKNAKTTILSIVASLALATPALAATNSADQLLAEGNAAANAGDFRTALDLFQKACAKKSTKACNYVGFVHAEGRTGMVDLDAASTAFEQACKLGNLSGCSRAKSIKDYKLQVATLETNCAADNGEACNTLAQLHMIWKTGDNAKNRSTFAKACRLGDDDGCYNHAVMTRDGLGGEKDVSAAITGFKKLCDQKHEQACKSLKGLEEATPSGS